MGKFSTNATTVQQQTHALERRIVTKIKEVSPRWIIFFIRLIDSKAEDDEVQDGAVVYCGERAAEKRTADEDGSDSY